MPAPVYRALWMALLLAAIILVMFVVADVLANNETGLAEADETRHTDDFSFRCDGTYGVYLAGHGANIFVVPNHSDCVLDVGG